MSEDVAPKVADGRQFDIIILLNSYQEKIGIDWRKTQSSIPCNAISICCDLLLSSITDLKDNICEEKQRVVVT